MYALIYNGMEYTYYLATHAIYQAFIKTWFGYRVKWADVPKVAHVIDLNEGRNNAVLIKCLDRGKYKIINCQIESREIKMANLFTKLAQQAVANSVVREGRTKITTEEIQRNYPDGITILQFDMLTTRDKKTHETITFPCIAFEEDDTKFYNGGSALKKIVDSWLGQFEGDVEQCNKALMSVGGVKIKLLPPVRTLDNNQFVPIEVIG